VTTQYADRRGGLPLPSGPASRRNNHGSSAVEVALLVPALVILLGLMVGGGRLWFARTTVSEAAQMAARSASLSRSAEQAAADGAAAGQASLDTGGLRCTDQQVSVDTAAFAVPVGTPATVRSHVTCSVPFGDVFLPGMPGSIRLSSDASSALDTYRSRQR
jgi:Flp pilus assembly protein TadG